MLDLFSGIGGFSLGLERAGMTTVAFCEIDHHCRQVLAKHWPDIPIYEDIKQLTAKALDRDGLSADVICGGFPCQDISDAGPRVGISGERSGLWFEYQRLIGEIRPKWVIIENVLALRFRGLGAVLRSLDEIGYDAEWHCIPATAVGAPHRRDRIWIIAYPAGSRPHAPTLTGLHRKAAKPGAWNGEPERLHNSCSPGALASAKPDGMVRPNLSGEWRFEPAMARMVDGVSRSLVREEIRQLGNAVLPQIPEEIGRAIMAAETEKGHAA